MRFTNRRQIIVYTVANRAERFLSDNLVRRRVTGQLQRQRERGPAVPIESFGFDGYRGLKDSYYRDEQDRISLGTHRLTITDRIFEITASDSTPGLKADQEIITLGA